MWTPSPSWSWVFSWGPACSQVVAVLSSDLPDQSVVLCLLQWFFLFMSCSCAESWALSISSTFSVFLKKQIIHPSWLRPLPLHGYFCISVSNLVFFPDLLSSTCNDRTYFHINVDDISFSFHSRMIPSLSSLTFMGSKSGFPFHRHQPCSLVAYHCPNN